MKNALLVLALLNTIQINANAQFCNGNACYQENSCFTQSQINSRDYEYAIVKNIYKSATASVALYITVFSPCNLPDSLNINTNTPECRQCKRPFILLIHGGGFREGCRTLMNKEGIEFAKRGYVAATIDYRVGWVPGDEKRSCKNFCMTGRCHTTTDDSCKSAYKDSTNFATYRAIQDASAAMRFITYYAKDFNIDTSYLYIGGQSAGSIIATNLAYMNQSELNNAMPGVNTVLGLYNNYGNKFTNTYRISGLFNNWGSLKDTSYINGQKDKIPMIGFHGIDDTIVPFAKGFPLNCKNGAYGYTRGSSLLYKRLTNNYPDLAVELYACYGDHGIFNNDPKTDPKSLYRIQKAVCFFNRVRNGDKSRNYIRINKQEEDITYTELILRSPVNCIADNLNNGIAGY